MVLPRAEPKPCPFPERFCSCIISGDLHDPDSQPNPGPGGDTSAPVQTPLTGKSCIYLPKGISPLKAYPLSNPVVKNLLGKKGHLTPAK